MKVYTIRDIAEMAGVSVTTVSRVLNHRPDVNQATRKKVEEIIRECHFVGNSNARGLKQGNEVIGVVIRGRSNPFLSSLAEAILDRADTVPDNFVTEYIDEKDDEFLTALRITRQNTVKGLIFVGSLIDDRVRAIKGMDVPMVFTTVNAETAALPRASSVAVDDRAMGRLVAEELLSLGHTRTAVFGSNPVAGDSLAMRFSGFCEAYTERGLTYDKSLYRETRFSYDAGYEIAKVFFAEQPDVTALFAMSDTVAVGAIRALKDLGRSVPEDVSIVGFDGIDISRFMVPRLTTVEQPVDEIARRSVNLLLDMMEKDAAPRHILVEAAFRKRESLAQCKHS
jgi:LacI family transcriptional regulator